MSGTFIWMKTIDFWAIPFSSNPNTNFLLEPNSRKAEISHCIIYEISAFRLFTPLNYKNMLKKRYIRIIFILIDTNRRDEKILNKWRVGKEYVWEC